MKIQVTGAGTDLNLTLPTKLIFNSFVLKRVLKSRRLTKAVNGLSPEAADQLVAELNRIKKKQGSWTLVEVLTADGEQVTITI